MVSVSLAVFQRSVLPVSTTPCETSFECESSPCFSSGHPRNRISFGFWRNRKMNCCVEFAIKNSFGLVDWDLYGGVKYYFKFWWTKETYSETHVHTTFASRFSTSFMQKVTFVSSVPLCSCVAPPCVFRWMMCDWSQTIKRVAQKALLTLSSKTQSQYHWQWVWPVRNFWVCQSWCSHRRQRRTACPWPQPSSPATDPSMWAPWGYTWAHFTSTSQRRCWKGSLNPSERWASVGGTLFDHVSTECKNVA